ncbi:hypothetical protein DesfrDRAFT_0144 [Solidesulfovibrio fructosivorans JJ]]|uniref:Uncharacterized protein n=1 Tax=Solidesulfovibrio fructosivorans JJ] TaxID=596151 RepID=E1JR95_SOLFR|nr:hypothetical protein [Solidesulfovibrio fructosivorans]EFL53096.1 hypothetical protein DesfrDRAFT_0144 [Solidesulfovibrio fructosivorans JJ]]
MKIALTSAFVLRGKHYKAGDCLEVEESIGAAAINDGAAEQVFDLAASASGDTNPKTDGGNPDPKTPTDDGANAGPGKSVKAKS